jgi:hypothetical protein
VPMAAHDEQVGVVCSIDQYRCGLALYDGGFHRYVRGIPKGCLHRGFQLLRRVSGEIHICPVRGNAVRRRALPGRHRAQPGASGPGIPGGPTQRGQGLVRRIDPTRTTGDGDPVDIPSHLFCEITSTLLRSVQNGQGRKSRTCLECELEVLPSP